MDRSVFYTFLFFLLSLSVPLKAQPPALTLVIHSIDPACNASSGAIFASANGGTGPYTYTFKGINAGSQSDFQGLQAGTYVLSVTDATGATASQTVTLTQKINPPQVTVSAYTNPTGCGQDNGTITLTASGGTPPYIYSSDLVNWQTSNFFSNMAANAALDLYPLYVQDANGCRSFAPNSPVLTSNCPITIWGWDFLSLIYGCGGTTSHIHITGVYGGTIPYTYSLDGSTYQSSPNFDNLGAGFYRVHVKDATGLIVIQGFLISDECQLTATYTATDASCNNNDGTVTVTASNASPPYQYSLDGVSYQTSNVLTGLSSGTHRIIVRELYGATFTMIATVFDNCPIVTAIATDATCGNSNGTLTADGSNGTAPYQYSIDGTHFQVSPLFSNLSAGSYTVYIKDNNGLIKNTSTTIRNLCLQASASPTPSTCGRSNGTITAIVSNGTSPYQYALDGTHFQSSNFFDQYPAGPYTITIKDAAGLQTTATATITDIPGPGIAATETPAGCLNNDGSLTAANTGGTAPFQYSLDGTNYQSSGLFTRLPAGTQAVYIQDGNGCTATQSFLIPQTNDISADAGPDRTICEGKSAALTGRTNGISYSWSPATGLSDPSVLNPVASPQITTRYTLTAATGACNSTSSMTVNVTPAPLADAGNGVTVCYGKPVQLTGSGGLCTWTPATGLDDPHSATPEVISPTQTITYQLMVTDGNGCSSLTPSAVTVTVTPPGSLFAGNDTSILAGQPLPLNAVDVNNSGFNHFTWSPQLYLNNAFIQDPIAHPTENIVYSVAASTPDGCTGSGSISIKVYAVSDIFVPSAFTPNGDGHNDLLKAIPIGIRDFKFLAVYNRWGQLIFQTADPARGWDGTFNGQPQSTGVFVWMTAGIDYKGALIQRKGTVVLAR